MTILSSALSSLLGGSGETWSWQDNLHAASFRGVPFAVQRGEGEFGRRQAVHEYPYRDSVWVEDMGRSTRRITLTGFILQSSLVYTASDVLTQRNSLVAAAELAGPGTLVHPTLGELTVSIPEGGLRIHESVDEGRMFRFTLTTIESGLKVFAITTATDAASTVKTSWLSLISKAAATVISEVSGDLRTVTQAVKTLKSTIAFWKNLVTNTITQASNLSSTLKSTFGTTRYGRYNTGSVGGNSSGATATTDNTADTDDYDALVATKIAASVQNTAAVNAALSGIDSTGTVEEFPVAVQAVITSILASVTGIADLITMLETLSNYSDTTYRQDSSDTKIATAAGIYLTIIAAGAMAYTASTYTPASYDEAMALLTRVRNALEAVTLKAADAGYDDVYRELLTLRTATVATLQSNGASLAHVVDVSFNAPLPALAVANRLYQDASRTEGVVKMADPVHPAFMPTSFKALTS